MTRSNKKSQIIPSPVQFLNIVWTLELSEIVILELFFDFYIPQNINSHRQLEYCGFIDLSFLKVQKPAKVLKTIGRIEQRLLQLLVHREKIQGKCCLSLDLFFELKKAVLGS